jgi:DNA mismatch repair protein MutL
VKGIPTILAHRDPQEMLGAIADSGFAGNPTADLAQNLLATYACHSAVRAGEDLGPDELRRLMREASEVDFQHNCPHGRRVFRWWETSQIAGWFDR